MLNICSYKEHKAVALSVENSGIWPVTVVQAAFHPFTFRKRAPSTVPVVAKLQQEPQMAWSFTGVTAPARAELELNTRMTCQEDASLVHIFNCAHVPYSLQSSESGTFTLLYILVGKGSPLFGVFPRFLPLMVASSDMVRSDREFRARE